MKTVGAQSCGIEFERILASRWLKASLGTVVVEIKGDAIKRRHQDIRDAMNVDYSGGPPGKGLTNRLPNLGCLICIP